jgi:hypothetical protein
MFIIICFLKRDYPLALGYCLHAQCFLIQPLGQFFLQYLLRGHHFQNMNYLQPFFRLLGDFQCLLTLRLFDFLVVLMRDLHISS